MSDEVLQIAVELRRHLAWQEDEGVRLIYGDRAQVEAARAAKTASPQPAGPSRAAAASPVAAAAEAPLFRPPSRPLAPPAAPKAVAAPVVAEARPATPAAPSANAVLTGKTLDEIRRELGDCQRCKLCKGRTNLVYGVGNPRAELVFVGEGPGADEDVQGVPFVGKAGQLLTKMIEAMKYSRDDVYICNVVKCRPPNNRNPEPDEIAACEPFLKAQLAAVQPKVIVALGKFAAQTLLRDPSPISRLRGQWRRYEGIELMPTFHPAFLLRDPSQKRLAWLDLQEVMKKFGKATT